MESYDFQTGFPAMGNPAAGTDSLSEALARYRKEKELRYFNDTIMDTAYPNVPQEELDRYFKTKNVNEQSAIAMNALRNKTKLQAEQQQRQGALMAQSGQLSNMKGFTSQKLPETKQQPPADLGKWSVKDGVATGSGVTVTAAPLEGTAGAAPPEGPNAAPPQDEEESFLKRFMRTMGYGG